MDFYRVKIKIWYLVFRFRLLSLSLYFEYKKRDEFNGYDL